MYIDSTGRIVASDELKHFGILGMHWGIRRFQPYPKGHTGDGKFVGENSKSGSSGTSNVSAGKQERYRRLESHKTGVKEIDNAIAFANKNNIPVKPKWGEVTGDAKESAEIGLKAVNVVRGPDYLDDEYDHTDWFVFEDQTIGMYEVADLARQGKSKEEIKSIVREASKVYGSYENLPSKDYEKNRKLLDDNTAKGTTEALFDLDEFRLYQLRDDGTGKGEQFIDECIKEAEKRKNLKHSYELTISNSGHLVVKDDYLAHHGILGQRWGRKNGPPYPLGAGDHSASEKKAGWRKSLSNVAKATGSGVARGVRATARGVGKGVVGTAKGVAAVAKGTKKALIRVNLYPKQLMSDQDIVDKLNRMNMEDAIKRARGKMTAEDKLNLKLKKKDARRELAKNVLGQLIPAIGKDLIIKAMNDRRAAKLEIKKKEAFTELENDSKRLQKELENDSKRLQTELDIKKSTAKTDNDIREHREKEDIDAQNARKAKMYEYEDKVRDQMFNDLIGDGKGTSAKAVTRNGKTIDRATGLDMIKNLNSDYGVYNTERLAREAEEAKQRKNAEAAEKRQATIEANQQRQAEAQRRLDAKNEAAAARESFNAWATKRQRDVYIKVKNQSMDNVAKLGGTVLNFSGGKITYENKFGRTETIDVGNAAERIFEQERRERAMRDAISAFGG